MIFESWWTLSKLFKVIMKMHESSILVLIQNTFLTSMTDWKTNDKYMNLHMNNVAKRKNNFLFAMLLQTTPASKDKVKKCYIEIYFSGALSLEYWKRSHQFNYNNQFLNWNHFVILSFFFFLIKSIIFRNRLSGCVCHVAYIRIFVTLWITKFRLSKFIQKPNPCLSNIWQIFYSVNFRFLIQ